MGHCNCYNCRMKIVTSNSSHGTYFKVLDEMKKVKRDGGRIVVIAPDRFTASVERGLLSTLGAEGSFDIEVMSFTRMAERCVGADIKKCLTPEGSVMLIGRVIDDCLSKGELCYYGKAAGREGFASELYAALTAIRNSGISTDKLQQAADAAKPALKRKLTDIVTVYKGYLAALEGKHSDSTTRLEHLAKYIMLNPGKFAGTHYFCTDINEFSEPEYAILQALSQCAGSLTVGVESGIGYPNERIYPDRVLKKLASLTPDKTQVIGGEDETLSEPVKLIAKNLFSYRQPESPVEAGDSVRVRVAKDRMTETLRLALDVIAHVRAGGRYKDFEVYASDISDYENEIKSVFTRYDIPFFIDKRAPLTEQTKVRYMLDAIACARSGMAVRETLDFVKNPLFTEGLPGGIDSAFKFENYVLEHGTDQYMFGYSFDDKSQKKALNISNSDDKPSNLQISPQEAVRIKLIEALKPFEGLTGGAKKDVKLFVDATIALLNSVESADAAHVERLAMLSKYYLKCAEQVDKKLSSVFDEIKDVLDFETDIAGYEGVLKGMLKTLKISLVPTYLDCVFVGDGDSRFMGDGKLYVLGATNDKFPQISGGGAVISERDEESLSSLGVPIVPSSRQKAYAEMFKILELIKKPRGGIVICYPESGGTSLLRRSSVIDELEGLLLVNGEPIKAERIDFSRPSALSEEDAVDLLITKKGASFQAISSFGSAGIDAVLGTAYNCMREEDKFRISPRTLLPERIVMPKGSFRNTESVSRLETFFACPYRHFMKYVLALKPLKEGELQGTEFGTILHCILENFFKAVKDGTISCVGDIRAAAERYFEQALAEVGLDEASKTPQIERALIKLKEEGVAVCEQLYEIYLRSDFKPMLLEAHIEDMTDVSLEAGGDSFKLKGQIDRVDSYGDNFIVIDYKSFKTADIDLSDVYFGKKLQLYVYMYAVEKASGLKPAGAFYLPIYVKFGKDGVARFEYKGHACDDIELLSHIDGALGGEGASVTVYKNKDGTLNRKRHFAQSELEMLSEYAIKLAGAGAHEIASGYIKPSPAEKCNEYCDYYDICAFKEVARPRKSEAPPLDKFLTTYGSANGEDGDGGQL